MSKKEMSLTILRKVVVDAILLIALGLCIYAATSVWQPFRRGFFCGDESLMFPYRPDTISVPLLRFIQCAPVIAFLICEWALLHGEGDSRPFLRLPVPLWLRGFYCCVVAYATGVIFVELCALIAKNTIGRPRPHFFDLCRPSVDCNATEWRGRYIQPHEYRCTGPAVDAHRIADMQLSFLSGHSASSAFSMIYLALYLEERMRWRGSRTLRHTLQFLAVMVSWFTALSRISDYKHHWSDVLAGYAMGLVFAVLVWRWGTDWLRKEKEEPSPNLPQHDITLVSHQPVYLGST